MRLGAFLGGVFVNNKRYKPLYDRVYITVLLCALIPVLSVFVFALFEPKTLFVAIPTLLFVAYFVFSSACGYAELREATLYIKFGFFLNKEIPYSSIRRVEKRRSFYSQSMAAIKSAMEHVDVYYNAFDVVSVGVIDNEGFLKELEVRIRKNV